MMGYTSSTSDLVAAVPAAAPTTLAFSIVVYAFAHVVPSVLSPPSQTRNVAIS